MYATSSWEETATDRKNILNEDHNQCLGKLERHVIAVHLITNTNNQQTAPNKEQLPYLALTVHLAYLIQLTHLISLL